MKLIRNKETCDDVFDQDCIDFDSESLRKSDEKFYKIFDLNPCPMAISEMSTNKIIDVNESFINIIGSDRYNILGKDTTEGGLNIINSKHKSKMYNIIKGGKEFKNIMIPFRTINGRKLRGLFSGGVIELNNKKYIITICQIINNECLFSIFKTCLTF